MQQKGRIVVPLDGMSLEACLALVSKLGSRPFAYKIHDLWDCLGPESVNQLQKAGAGSVWVDLKLHDIPETVALRARWVQDAGADILTVHAGGEIEMMMAAVENGPGLILAVTILTSIEEERVHLLTGQPAKAAVLYRARMAKLAGVHGVVCSPQEVALLAKRPELMGMKLVTPGIRLTGQEAHDQKRIDTPSAAIKAGSDILVVGIPITKAVDPVAAFELISAEIERALAEKSAS